MMLQSFIDFHYLHCRCENKTVSHHQSFTIVAALNIATDLFYLWQKHSV